VIARAMLTLAITRVGRHFGVSERRPFRPDLWSRNQVSHGSASAGWAAPQACLISAVLARLTKLGADVTVQLGSENDTAILADAAGEGGIDAIVDYLWGSRQKLRYEPSLVGA
jgi:hypothetical protein